MNEQEKKAQQVGSDFIKRMIGAPSLDAAMPTSKVNAALAKKPERRADEGKVVTYRQGDQRLVDHMPGDS